MISEARQRYTKNLSNKVTNPDNGAKIFWSSFKRLLNSKKSTNIPPILENGSLITNFKVKASAFNKYFAEQCKIWVNDSSLPTTSIPLTSNRLSAISISSTEIIKIISKLNSKKASTGVLYMYSIIIQ